MKFFTTYFFIFLLVFSCLVSKGQTNNPGDNCGSKGPSREWQTEFQKLVDDYQAKRTAGKAQQTYVIPVIFHIIHGGEPVGVFPNVPQSMATDQIVTMNNDFAGSGFYAANHPATAFAAWAATANVSPASLNANGGVAVANCGIEFCLATKDTNGNLLAEPGIQRYNYNAMGWPNPSANSFSTLATFSALYDYTVKPQTIWDPTKYLNVWVGMSNGALGIGGYAYYPDLSTLNGLQPASEIATPTNDGIYCHTYQFGYLQHVMAHEAGHYLGLIHTWGDDYCGSDYCNDTPPEAQPTFGSPSYPFGVNACGSSGNGVMFMNYMDYANNNAMYMFSTDQANRIQTAMANSPNRKFLGTHNLCSVDYGPAFTFFDMPNSGCTGKAFKLDNFSLGWPAPYSFTWTASGGTFIPGPQVLSPNIQFDTPGIYTITLATTNGTVGVYTETISITSPGIIFSSMSETICPGQAASFTVDGVTNFTWQPGSVVSSMVSFTPAASQTYTCFAEEINGCRTNSVVEVVVAACTGLDVYQADQLEFTIYPNPAKSRLNLVINNFRNQEFSLHITDALGRVVYMKQLDLSSGKQQLEMDVAAFDPGIYSIRLTTQDGSVKSGKFVKSSE